MDGRTYRRMYRRKISPFYRTSSPIWAAALPPPMKTKEKVEQGKGTANHLMPLGYLLKKDFSANYALHTMHSSYVQISANFCTGVIDVLSPVLS